MNASGLKKPAFLRFQREDRNEAHGDDEQREEERTSDAFRRRDDDLDALAVVRIAPMLVAEMLQRLVRVLHHDDRRIDHRADGDGDAAERHDVRGESEPVHREEREDDRDRQRDDRDERRAHVPEEHDADQRDDDAFLDQLFAQRVDGVMDQFAAVVGRHDSHALGQRRLDFLQLLFDAVDDGERIFAVAHDDDAADDFALAVQLRDAAPDVRAEMHGADVLDVNWRAVLDLEHDVLDVSRSLM